MKAEYASWWVSVRKCFFPAFGGCDGVVFGTEWVGRQAVTDGFANSFLDVNDADLFHVGRLR